MTQENNNLTIIEKSNQSMLEYFNELYLDELAKIQDLRTQVFEIDIKVEELKKTKDVYSYHSNTRKNVFSPISSESPNSERGKIIDEQIHDLENIKVNLDSKILTMEVSLNSIKRRLDGLYQAKEAIKEITSDPNIGILRKKDADGFEYVESDKNTELTNHGYNIIMQNAFEKSYLSTLINKNVKENFRTFNHKLEMLSYMITSDTQRARQTISELKETSSKMETSIDSINSKLTSITNSSKPIWTLLDDFILEQRELHPEFVVTTDIECLNNDQCLHPVFSISLMELLKIFFDNAFMHSNGNTVDLKLSLSANVLEATIHDNGIGISPNYMSKSPWYSSLHRANEIIYLLDGSLDITGDVVSGTTINFRYSVQY